MPQTNRLVVEIHPTGDTDEVPFFDDVHYISFVSSPGGQGEGTYGIPAIISEERRKAEGLPLRVLYVNPQNIVAMSVTREA